MDVSLCAKNVLHTGLQRWHFWLVPPYFPSAYMTGILVVVIRCSIANMTAMVVIMTLMGFLFTWLFTLKKICPGCDKLCIVIFCQFKIDHEPQQNPVTLS